MRRPSEKMIEVLKRMELGKRYEPALDEYATFDGLSKRGLIRQINYRYSIWRRTCSKYHFCITDLGIFIKELLNGNI